LVHPHIQVAFKAKGETAGGFVELVAADAKIGEDTIYRGDFMQPKESSQVAKVVGQEPDARVIGQIVPRIFILIEGEESASRSEPFQNTP
jgi:hypothetical protein